MICKRENEDVDLFYLQHISIEQYACQLCMVLLSVTPTTAGRKTIVSEGAEYRSMVTKKIIAVYPSRCH